ncbi:MAG TPA: CRISPR-associated helicase Cas3', partial [Chthoniobacterales bacterium]|nr:CRISPR-associated helicase Cas3' [Chthoniobacterales bacterium]
MCPGISVQAHCLNVGCVAEALLEMLPAALGDFAPAGAVTLAALHDIGKISCGFQVKCPEWLVQHDLTDAALQERWATGAESDHAKITQAFLQKVMKPARTHGWGVAAGVHHGRIFGRSVGVLNVIGQREECETQAREALLKEMTAIFGALPAEPPKDDAALWWLAGLISVADWIGSNEAFFPADRGLPVEESRDAASSALRQIHWGGGKLRTAKFPELFDGFQPNLLQEQVHAHCEARGLFIVEGPMGCGKTEAALWAAHRLIAAGANDGIYFALPTQVTSNRIHQRVASFLRDALEDVSTLRLAHSASWLEQFQTTILRPAVPDDAQAAEHAREGRSWFASAKHALLARFGVGTVDQALQGVVAVKHFFVRRFGLAGKVVILDEVHSYDVYTSTLITRLIQELLALRCSVIVLSATLTRERRAELITAAEGEAGSVESTAYPLVTVAVADEPVREIDVAPGATRSVKIKTAAFTEAKIIDECIARAETGQQVLYLRNTVVEAQATCRAVVGSSRANRMQVGLLHSRFPFFRRQELENEWLVRLGRDRVSGKGSILIATQVVEQSVDIDLDFIVTDLAPTDMLLQRMGRLWRHERIERRAREPEFWINTPAFRSEADAAELKRAFGRSGRVYAPYVLLRTAEVFVARPAVALPDDIRTLLEATYAERSEFEERPGAQELRDDVAKTREKHQALAQSATKVFGQQSQADLEGKLTRLRGARTCDLLLLRSCEMMTRDRWRITPLDGAPLTVSAYEWSFTAARALHRNLVR